MDCGKKTPPARQACASFSPPGRGQALIKFFGVEGEREGEAAPF